MVSPPARRPQLRKIDTRIPIATWGTLPSTLRGRDAEVFVRIDGMRTVHAIAQAMGSSDELVAATLTMLEQLGLVSFLTPSRSSLLPGDRASAPPSSTGAPAGEVRRISATQLSAVREKMPTARFADDDEPANEPRPSYAPRNPPPLPPGARKKSAP